MILLGWWIWVLWCWWGSISCWWFCCSKTCSCRFWCCVRSWETWLSSYCSIEDISTSLGMLACGHRWLSLRSRRLPRHWTHGLVRHRIMTTASNLLIVCSWGTEVYERRGRFWTYGRWLVDRYRIEEGILIRFYHWRCFRKKRNSFLIFLPYFAV